MHHILNHHDNVFIPGREIYFFDIDDVQQHPDFFMDDRGKWIFHDYEHHCKDYLEWYSSFFQNAADGQVIGEDSTTYMASSKAPPRIARLLPNVKLIFMLRDPVSRAYISLLALGQQRPCHLRLRRHLATHTWYYFSARLLQRTN